MIQNYVTSDSKNLNITIVEDEAIIALDISECLKRAGYNVMDIMFSGEQAVMKIPSLKPDLIIMDILLRGQIDGIEAAERIALTCDIPVVFITARTDSNTLYRIKFTDYYGIIFKPFQHSDVLGAVRTAYSNYCSRQIFLENCSKIKRSIKPNKFDLVERIDELLRKLSGPEEEGNIVQVVNFLKDLNDSFKPHITHDKVALLLIDRDGIITYVNQDFSQLFAISKERLLNSSIYSFLDQDNADRLSKLFEDCSINEDKGVFLDFAFEQNGDKLYIHCYVEKLMDRSGKIFLGLVSISNNLNRHSELFDKINIRSYENGILEINSFLKGLKSSIVESLEQWDEDTENINRQLRRSIFKIISYADYMLDEIEHLSLPEIKEYAGRISVYLKALSELAETG